MMIGGITLDNDMIWTDEFEYFPLTGTAERAIDGHLVVQSFSTTGGRSMTLAGDVDRGWQKRSTVLALQALADPPGAEIEVVMPSGATYTTMFRVEETPIISFQPIAPASAPDGDFWYYGTINLRIL